MKRIFFSLIGLWCIMCLCIRCYMNMPGFQTGRTVGNGKASYTASYNRFFNSPVFFEFGDDEFREFKLRNVQSFEQEVKFGLVEKLDLGIRAGIFAGVGTDLKYQILGDKQSFFASSLGFGVGQQSSFYWQVPIYLSIHPSEQVSVYLTPRYLHVKNQSYTNVYGAKFNFLGTNAGVLYGWKKTKFGLDAGYFHVTGAKQNFHTFTIGIGVQVLFF